MRTRPESRQSCRAVPRQQRPSIIHSRTFTIGPLPGDLQDTIVFAAAIMGGAKSAEAAKVLVDFLRTPEAAAVIKAKGMEPAAP
jgi:ABC-type molybdate transport system substrate-binding protein